MAGFEEGEGEIAGAVDCESGKAEAAVAVAAEVEEQRRGPLIEDARVGQVQTERPSARKRWPRAPPPLPWFVLPAAPRARMEAAAGLPGSTLLRQSPQSSV